MVTEEMERLLASALNIVRAYATANPEFEHQLGTMDPCGAHGWLKQYAALDAAALSTPSPGAGVPVRKIVQITATDMRLYAVCSDGTVWWMADEDIGWTPIQPPSVPTITATCLPVGEG